MSEHWRIEVLEDGTGTIAHLAAPRFRAHWTTGLDDLASLDGLCWTSEASGEADALTFYAFAWDNPPPAQPIFEALMQEAATALDEWIAQRF
jgi:hypothetical protein